MALREPKFLWIDGFGGYSFCIGSKVSIGLATLGSGVDLRVRGRIASHAGTIDRLSGGDFLVRQGELAGPADRGEFLLDGSSFALGEVHFKYLRPSPLSNAATLRLIGPGSWSDPIDGAILAGSSVLIGPYHSAHVPCHDAESGLVLFAMEDGWGVRTLDGSGKPMLSSASIPLVIGRRLECGEFSICLE